MWPLAMWSLELIAPVEVDWAKAVPVSTAQLKAKRVRNREIFVIDVSSVSWISSGAGYQGRRRVTAHAYGNSQPSARCYRQRERRRFQMESASRGTGGDLPSCNARQPAAK